MAAEKSLHSICRWTFNPGRGGFVPADMRPEWGGDFGTPEMIKLVKDKVAPRLPDNVELGIEMHYDPEIEDKKVAEVAKMQIDWVCHLVCGALPCLVNCPDTLAHFNNAQTQEKNPRQASLSGPRRVVIFVLVFCFLVFVARTLYPQRIDKISLVLLSAILLCMIYLLEPKRAWSWIRKAVSDMKIKMGILEIRVDRDKTSPAEGEIKK